MAVAFSPGPVTTLSHLGGPIPLSTLEGAPDKEDSPGQSHGGWVPPSTSTSTSPGQAMPRQHHHPQHQFLPQSNASIPFLYLRGCRKNSEVLGVGMLLKIKNTKQKFSGQGTTIVLCQAHSVPSTGATNTYKCTTHSPCSSGLKSMNAPILGVRNDSNPTHRHSPLHGLSCPAP